MKLDGVLALLFMRALLACGQADGDALPGVRLGMAPRDVRERFDPGHAGLFQTRLGAGDETLLAWEPASECTTGPCARVTSATFEFHLGMLVAIRAETTEPTHAERVAASEKIVTAKSPDAKGGTTITVLARDCPTHKDEAAALARRAP